MLSGLCLLLSAVFRLGVLLEGCCSGSKGGMEIVLAILFAFCSSGPFVFFFYVSISLGFGYRQLYDVYWFLLLVLLVCTLHNFDESLFFRCHAAWYVPVRLNLWLLSNSNEDLY